MEQRYTLAEAKQKIAEEDCKFLGHDFEHVTSTNGTLVALCCARCHAGWKVEPL
jgi:hypothetical protein